MAFVLFEAHPSHDDLALRIVQCASCDLRVTTEVCISEHNANPWDATTGSPREVMRPRDSTRRNTVNQKYQGADVRSVRDARDGDPGFVKDTDQVVVSLKDGSEKTVKRSEVKPA